MAIEDLNSYAASDTNYVTKFNNDRSTLISEVNALAAQIAQAFNGTGLLFAADWTRRIAAADPSNGVLGAYSCVFADDTGNDRVRLDADTADGVSSVVIAGERLQHSGDIELDLDDLSLSDGSYTVYAGVDKSGDTDFTAQLSTTADTSSLDLYSFDLDVVNANSIPYTVSNVQRADRTVLFDNTWFQLEQERVRPIPVTWFSESSTPDDIYVSVPFAHVVTGATLVVHSADSAATVLYGLRDPADTTNLVAVSFDNSSDDPGEVARGATVGGNIGIVRAADTVYRWNVTSSSNVVQAATLTLEVVPAYNVAGV